MIRRRELLLGSGIVLAASAMVACTGSRAPAEPASTWSPTPRRSPTIATSLPPPSEAALCQAIPARPPPQIRVNIRGIHPSGGPGGVILKDIIADNFGSDMEIAGADNGSAYVALDNAIVTGSGRKSIHGGAGGPDGPGGNVYADDSVIVQPSE